MMKRIFIFEGADGCGKSVAATELAQRRDPAILTRHGTYPGDGDRVWRRYLAAMLPAYADVADVVMDRSWLSEPIYGAAFRGGANRISVAQRRMLERVALGRGAVVVLARVPWKTCAENFKRRAAEGGEYLDSVERLKLVYDAYKKLAPTIRRADAPCPFRVVPYDFTRDAGKTRGGNTQLFTDLNFGSQAEENPGPGIGAWRPGKVTLLVGERPGGFGGRWHLPFVSLRRDGCSAWLADQLEAAGVPERDLYWVNAYDGPKERGAATAYDFIEALRPKKIIALGDAATAALLRTGSGSVFGRNDFVAVPHPQAWKRFQSKQPYPLITELTA